jgi:hypothetical protein
MTSNTNEESKRNRFVKTSHRNKVRRAFQNSHTLFFALFPPISLYAINIARFPGDQIFRSMIVLVLVGVGLGMLGWLIFRDTERATVLASLMLFFSMNYGHAYNGLKILVSRVAKARGVEFSLDDISVGVHIVSSMIWIALMLLVYHLATRKENWKRITPQFLILVAVVAFMIPSIRIAWTWGRIRPLLSENSVISRLDVELTPDIGLGKPDVYYILLDGYGREDILEEFFHYDNSYFLDELEEQGFFVAEKSRSNYSNTISSLASSINMNYLEDLAEIPSDDLLCRMLLSQSIDSSETMRIFRELGYEFIAFSTGFPSTEIADADVYFQSEEIGLNPFESLLVRNSILLPIFDISANTGIRLEYPGYSGHRERISFTLDQLPRLSSDPGPKFVFAHIVAPHPPFVFDAEGMATDQRYPYVFWDGDMFQGTSEEYIQGYSDQVTFLNDWLLSWIKVLQSESSSMPIILLQGDHGPRSTVVWRSPSKDAMREGTAILNASYLPGVKTSVLYDDVSPVNTFRIILNEYFNANLELLPDRTFFMSTGCQDFSTELK